MKKEEEKEKRSVISYQKLEFGLCNCAPIALTAHILVSDSAK